MGREQVKGKKMLGKGRRVSEGRRGERRDGSHLVEMEVCKCEGRIGRVSRRQVGKIRLREEEG